LAHHNKTDIKVEILVFILILHKKVLGALLCNSLGTIWCHGSKFMAVLWT